VNESKKAGRPRASDIETLGLAGIIRSTYRSPFASRVPHA
jgi:hypothetical protein